MEDSIQQQTDPLQPATVTEAAELGEVSASVIEYMIASRLVSPSVRGALGRGSARLFSENDILIIKALGLLKQVASNSLQQTVSTQLRENQIRGNIKMRFLIIRGDGVSMEDDNDLDFAGAYRLLLDLERLRSEIRFKAQAVLNGGGAR